MKRKTRYLIMVLVAALLVMSLLAACGGAEAPAVEESAAVDATAVPEVPEVAEPEPTSEPAPEPTEEPSPVEEVIEEVVAEPEELTEEDLNAAFDEFLAGMEKYNTISLEDTAVALAEDPPPFLLDVREIAEVEEKGHIEGAVVIPLRELAQNLDLMPSFDTPIITYCGSGWRATIAMSALQALGWEDVKVLKGGSYSGWVEAEYPIVEGLPPEAEVLNAAEPDPMMVEKLDAMLSTIPEGWGVITAEALNTELIENPDLILIDVRTEAEVEENGYIDAENIIFIPIEEFITLQDMWPEGLDAPIVVYCGSGHRSTIAMSILRSYDYTDVRSLKDGYGGWASEGYPTVGAPEAEGSNLDAAFATFLADMEAYNTIGLDELNLALAEDPPPFILDVREYAELEENGHIEGAVNIPLREVADNIQYLPSFDTPIVSYCGSGWRCTIALTALEAMGWEDVKGLKGGSFGGWVEGGYPVAEGAAAEPMELNAAAPDPAIVAEMQTMLNNVPEGFGVVTADDLNTALVENPDLILIDVRTAAEAEEKGVIEAENWLHISLEDFIAQKDIWPADLDAPIVVYCGSGHRSTIAMSILWSYGYTDVRSLKGGFGGWVEAGYPVAEAPEMAEAEGGTADLDAAFTTFLADMDHYNTISLEDMNAALAEDPPPFLLDVREVTELEEKGHIEGAVNIPLRELADNIQYLPSFDTPIVSYCGSGWRCTIAATALEAMGYEDVKCLKGGSFSGWVEAGYPVAKGAAAEPLELNAAEPDPAVAAEIQEMLQNVPEGFGGISADDLNTALVENPDLIVIDVRTAEEVAEQGVIEAENWLHIPLEEFIAQQDMWPEDRDAPIVVYCGSGHRSTIAMSILWAYGYSDVSSLKDGFSGWVEAGYPVVEFAAP